MMRYAGLTFSITLAAATALSLRTFDPDNSPLHRAQVLASDAATADPIRLRDLYREALARDTQNPYRWADYGDALLDSGDTHQAADCFRRAVDLAPGTPQIWVRQANFYFRTGQPAQALQAAARVLKIVPDFDPVLFSYFDALVPDVPTVLATIGTERRACRSWLEHLETTGNVAGAALTWRRLVAEHFATDDIAAVYVDFLLAKRLDNDARRTWASYLGDRSGGFPARNLVFNGSFESDPTKAALDWRITPSDQFETTRDRTVSKSGNWSIRIQFHGSGNVNYDNLHQTVCLPSEGEHVLRAWMRTGNLTTNEGLRFRIVDAESPGRLHLQTEPITGTHDWMLVQQTFHVPPQTHAIVLSVVRNPSIKFDNKVDGTAWIDSVSVEPVADGASR